MSKIVEINGASKPVSVKVCDDCPLLRKLDKCGHPDGPKGFMKDYDYLFKIADGCPLPNADTPVLPDAANEFIENRFGKETDRK